MKTTSRARSINILFVLIFTEKFSLGLEAISFQPAAIFLLILFNRDFLLYREKLAGSVTGQPLSYALSS